MHHTFFCSSYYRYLSRSLLGLSLLLGELEGLSEHLEEVLVLDLLVGLDDGEIGSGSRGQLDVSVLGDTNSGEELGDNLAVLLVVHVVGDDQTVVLALGKTHSALGGVLEDSDREGERSSLLLDLGEDSSRSSHLELVGQIGLLVDGGSGLALLDLSVSGGNQNVQSVHLVGLKGKGLEVLLLALGGVEDDLLLAVQNVLVLLVGQHTLGRLAAVGLADLVDVSSDIPVLVAGLDGSNSNLSSVPGSSDDVSDLAGHGSAANNEGISNNTAVAVDLGSKRNLDDIASLEGNLGLGIGGNGRQVGDTVVGGNGGGEGNALVDLLALEDGGDLGVEQLVTLDTNVQQLGAVDTKSLDLLQDLLGDLTGSSVLVDDLGVGEGSVDVGLGGHF